MKHVRTITQVKLELDRAQEAVLIYRDKDGEVHVVTTEKEKDARWMINDAGL